MQKNTVSLSWKVATALMSEPPIHNNTVVFNISSNVGLYSQFSLPLHWSYVPQLFEPTITYHNTIINRLQSDLGIRLAERKFPYKIALPVIDTEASFKLQVRFFPPNILSLTVNLLFAHDLTEGEYLIKCQNLINHSPVKEIIQWTMGLAESLDHNNYTTDYKFTAKPAIYLGGICRPDQFQEHFKQKTSHYISGLIRNSDKAPLSKELVTRIINKNNGHNLKIPNELLLIDKQGILYLSPYPIKRGSLKTSRISKAQDLYEIANIMGIFLENFFPSRVHNEDFVDFLLYKSRPWINKPEVVFRRSKSNQSIWNLLVEELELRGLLELVNEPDIIDVLSDKSRYFNQWASDWWNTENFENLITRKLERSRNVGFNFLSDPDLKLLIIKDYEEAISSLQGRNYKATVILCGSISEAILVDVLIQNPPSGVTTNQLLQYNLNPAIQAVKNNGLITNNELLALLQPLKDYRNLIHPGRQKRRSIAINSSIATIALETVNLLIKELQ